jgi:hypothetical protein
MEGLAMTCDHAPARRRSVFGPGLDEYLTLAIDPLIAAFLLRRWGFRIMPTGLAWLVCTVLAITIATIVVALLVSLLPRNANALHWTPVILAGAATLLLPRVVLLRKLSISPVFREGDLEPLGWRQGLAVSAVAFAVAMLLGTLAGLLPRIPA